MPHRFNRREFITRSIAAGTCAASLTGFAESPGTTPKPARVAPGSKGSMPMGKIGKLSVSRLITGGNLLSGWCHQRDLLFVAPLAQAYLTEEKQFDTLQALEERGVNTIVIDMIQLDLLLKYKQQRGGRMQTLVAVRQGWGDWNNPDLMDLQEQIAMTIDKGPDALFLHGGYCDRLVQAGKPERVELIGKALGFMRSKGFPAGLGCHALEVPMACDKQSIRPDFYFKTFHHDKYWSATPPDRRKRFCVDGPRSLDHNEFHDNIFCIDPEATIEYMLDKEQPWIAFKVLAAGAIHPKSGFKYAFENGADFVAVGMFDFEVEEDIQVAKDILKDVRRERPWCT
jgi:hypothetical protein